MKHDGTIDIALGHSAETLHWKNTKMLWSELVQKLSEEHKTKETYKEYMAASKKEQGKIKDVGGFVGGYLNKGKRSPYAVLHRQLLTLDIDFAHLHFWEDFCLQFDAAAVVHSTHKHHELSPRYRLILPVSRELSPDEFVAVSRKVAGILGIELFDNTTFETSRLMFWPSNSKDVPYYFQFQDGPWLDADKVLAMYVNWQDTSEWPTSKTHADTVRGDLTKQQDPENKRGIVGTFCRSYSLTEAIDTFLSSEYLPVGDGRYTYAHGSTAGGLVVYDDKFAYSHHGTDPSGGKLCNAFDLVRLHRFGHLDQEGTTAKLPASFKAMEELCLSDAKTKLTLAAETRAAAQYDFGEVPEEPTGEEQEEDLNWMTQLDADKQGRYFATANNLNLIFANDIRLKGLFRNNDFDSKRYIFGSMPWRKVAKPEPIKNVDYSGIRNYVESFYQISANLKIDDVLALEFERHSFHPVRDYLRALRWDGKPRVDTLLVDLFGAVDNLYTREAIRKTLVGAVARVMQPACKFDLVLTLVSQQQGTGKSSFFKALGREWFSDTFMTVQGKEALEQIQGAWIIEMAELAGTRKADVEAVKHFVTKQVDQFRPAYARASETYERQCIFVATTNQRTFLKDATGNRRFLPVDVQPLKVSDNLPLRLFLDSPSEVDQVWAEAFALWREGEQPFLSEEAERIAEEEQRGHSETDERTGIIEAYLAKELPTHWHTLDLFARRLYLSNETPYSGATLPRREVCIAEIWCECLDKPKEDMDQYKTRDLNSIMKSLEGWEQATSTRAFPIYGKQRFYFKV